MLALQDVDPSTTLISTDTAIVLRCFAERLPAVPRWSKVRRLDWVIEANDGIDPVFHTHLRTALAALYFDDRALFTAEAHRILWHLKLKGPKELYYKTAPRVGGADAFPLHQQAYQGLQAAITRALNGALLAALARLGAAHFLRTHSVDVVFHTKAGTIRANVDALRRIDLPTGSYFQAQRPRLLRHEGWKLPVLWSEHALERVEERVLSGLTHPIDRAFGFSDTYGYAGTYLAYEPVRLHEGQPAFTLYEYCRDGLPTGQYPVKILPSVQPGQHYCYRLGYCPVVRHEKRWWIVTTFLTPGMRSTPEYGAMVTHTSTLEGRARLLERADAHVRQPQGEQHDYALIKWWHQYVPQVKPLTHSLFEYDPLDVHGCPIDA